MAASPRVRPATPARRVERVLAHAIGDALDPGWDVDVAASALAGLGESRLTLRVARARVSEAVLTSPSLAGGRAVEALTLALERWGDEPPATPDSPVQAGEVPQQRSAPRRT